MSAPAATLESIAAQATDDVRRAHAGDCRLGKQLQRIVADRLLHHRRRHRMLLGLEAERAQQLAVSGRTQRDLLAGALSGG